MRRLRRHFVEGRTELTTVHDLTGLTTGNFEIIVHRRQFRIMNNVLVIIITPPSFVRV